MGRIWEIPRGAEEKWPTKAKDLHSDWWARRIVRQKAIDASIAAKAEFEYLYDKPYEDNKKVRVAGPFTVESLSPHRVLSVDEDDELIRPTAGSDGDQEDETDFVEMILENLKTAGVQQAHKDDKISFSSITPWPGYLVCAEGRYVEGGTKSGAEKRAAIFIGPEFGTVSRPGLVAAAREAGDAGFNVLITCAFNYDAHSSEFNKLGRIPVLKAHMNADLHMADDLKNTGRVTCSSFLASQTSISLKRKTTRFKSKSTVWMFFTLIPAKFVATEPKASRVGLLTPTTMKRASSFATHIFSARMIHTNLSRQH